MEIIIEVMGMELNRIVEELSGLNPGDFSGLTAGLCLTWMPRYFKKHTIKNLHKIFTSRRYTELIFQGDYKYLCFAVKGTGFKDEIDVLLRYIISISIDSRIDNKIILPED